MGSNVHCRAARADGILEKTMQLAGSESPTFVNNHTNTQPKTWIIPKTDWKTWNAGNIRRTKRKKHSATHQSKQDHSDRADRAKWPVALKLTNLWSSEGQGTRQRQKCSSLWFARFSLFYRSVCWQWSLCTMFITSITPSFSWRLQSCCRETITEDMLMSASWLPGNKWEKGRGEWRQGARREKKTNS